MVDPVRFGCDDLDVCGCTDPASTGAVISTDSTADVVVRTTVPEQASETVQSDDEGLPRSFYLLDADPAGVLALRLPSDSGELEARVGPWPDGGAGLCVVDAFGALPERVVCFEPGAEGRLFVPLESAGQPAVFMDSRVARVTLQSDVEPERELQLIDVPGVPGARITQGTAEVPRISTPRSPSTTNQAPNSSLPRIARRAHSDLPPIEGERWIGQIVAGGLGRVSGENATPVPRQLCVVADDLAYLVGVDAGRR